MDNLTKCLTPYDVRLRIRMIGQTIGGPNELYKKICSLKADMENSNLVSVEAEKPKEVKKYRRSKK